MRKIFTCLWMILAALAAAGSVQAQAEKAAEKKYPGADPRAPKKDAEPRTLRTGPGQAASPETKPSSAADAQKPTK
jgi:hypothetical protein